MKDNDIFHGDNKKLAESIEALLALDAKGALVPHGIGEHARTLLTTAIQRLTVSDDSGEKVSQLLVTRTAERDAALGREAELREDRNDLALQVERLKADNVNFDRLMCRAGNQRDALQQRLTAADERADLLEGLLREVFDSGEWYSSALEFKECNGFELCEKVESALKPADPGEPGGAQ